jgi:predicted dehydrogenase
MAEQTARDGGERPVRLGDVGCGFMAQKVHLPNFASIPGCALVALAEVRPKLRERVADRYRVPRRYESHEQLAADPEIEAVGLSAGFIAQGEMAADLLRAGKHVYMEKPMAVSVAQAERMLEAARAGGARLMVAYMKRYDAGNECAKATLDRWRASGEMGPITYARGHGFCGDWIQKLDTPFERTDEPAPPYGSGGPEWMPPEFRESYVGYLQQYTHNVNLLRWFLDGTAENTRVRAVDLDDNGWSGIVSLEMNGVRALLESGSVDYWGWEEHTQVYFRDGWVRTDAPALMHKDLPAQVEIYRGGTVHAYERPIPQPFWTWSYRREAEHFIEAVRSGAPFRSSGEDTLADVRLFEEIYRVYLQQRGVL